ncbi:sulfatase [Maribellus maritimus]|uniref:sulfatase n=1 Tax=Maribellus maritimus TaxID=2870838 RepID=UPI001EECD7C7|nr:sulfatase [Maribellus maritimus]MCG6187368.1 sulfatase [Maribellus maritimus]
MNLLSTSISKINSQSRYLFLLCWFILPNFSNAQPNILLIFSDDLNTRIGPYMDVNKHTPNLDRLASEGVMFTRAYCQYPLCGPSRASIMSGLYPASNGVLVNDDKPGSYKKINPALKDHPSMAGFFREQGYFTARVSKIFHMGVPGGIERGEPGGDDPTSWDYAFNVMGPETLSPGKLELLSPKSLHYGGNFARMILPDSLRFYQTDYIAANQAIAILESRAKKPAEGATNKKKIKPDAPFFLSVGFVRPHVPLISTESCFAHYPDEESVLPPVVVSDDVPEQALRRQNEKIWGMNEVQKKKTISSYMASVRFMDQQVGRLLNTLDQLDLRKNTIVIFLSDHGYNLGEHDCWSKTSLWEGTVRVPLIISVPETEDNYRGEFQSIVELIDLYPTLVDLCGYTKEAPDILQGQSLADVIKNGEQADKKTEAFTVTDRGESGTLVFGDYRYTRWGAEVGADNEELYNHMSDPEEHKNLVNNASAKNDLETMRKRFDKAKEKSTKTLTQ